MQLLTFYRDTFYRESTNACGPVAVLPTKHEVGARSSRCCAQHVDVELEKHHVYTYVIQSESRLSQRYRSPFLAIVSAGSSLLLKKPSTEQMEDNFDLSLTSGHSINDGSPKDTFAL